MMAAAAPLLAPSTSTTGAGRKAWLGNRRNDGHGSPQDEWSREPALEGHQATQLSRAFAVEICIERSSTSDPMKHAPAGSD